MVEEVWSPRGARLGLLLRQSRVLPLRRAHALLILLLVAELAYLTSGIRQVVNAYDEGFAVYGASRVLHGDLPYRDFWTIYAPAQFYVLAALFGLFEETLLVERLWDSAVRFALVVLAFLVAAVLSTPWRAALVSLVATLWLGAADYYGYAAFPALVLVLLGVLLLLRYAAAPRWGWLVAAGAAIGLATLFRHDFGAYAALASAAALGAHTLLSAVPRPRSLLAALPRLVGSVLVLALGVLLPLLPVAFYFLAQVPAHVLWSDLVLFPVFINRQISYLALPDLLLDLGPLLRGLSPGDYLLKSVDPWLWFYLPLAVFAATALVLAGRLRSAEQRGSAQFFGLLLLVLLGLGMFNHTLNRYDRMHALPSAITALILVAARVPWRPLPRRWWPVGLVAAPLAALLLVSFVVLPARARVMDLERFSPLICHATFERAGCADLYPEQEDALGYIRAHTAPGERIFVGNLRHDRIHGSDILFYFLADRHSPSRFHELVAEVANTLPVQRQIVEDLERHGVRYVVLSAAEDGIFEPNLSSAHSGVTLLDDYLRAHYAPVADFGNYTIWLRQE